MLLARALFAVAVLPGFFAGFVPWALAARDPWRGAGNDLGTLVGGAGVGILFLTVREFFVTGRGTLAPWDPPRHLVVAGLYRWMRNPMYVGVLLTILGMAVTTGSPLVAEGLLTEVPLDVRPHADSHFRIYGRCLHK